MNAVPTTDFDAVVQRISAAKNGPRILALICGDLHVARVNTDRTADRILIQNLVFHGGPNRHLIESWARMTKLNRPAWDVLEANGETHLRNLVDEITKTAKFRRLPYAKPDALAAELADSLAAYDAAEITRRRAMAEWNAFAGGCKGKEEHPADLRPDLVRACEAAERAYTVAKQDIVQRIRHEYACSHQAEVKESELRLPNEIRHRARLLLSEAPAPKTRNEKGIR